MARINDYFGVKGVVMAVLEVNDRARDSDRLLYAEVCKRLNPSALNAPFGVILSHMDDFGLPPFESVRRARQKVQAERPDLAPSLGVKAERAKKELEFRAFARTKGVR